MKIPLIFTGNTPLKFLFQAYYNDNAVKLLRNILAGGIDGQLEEILAEGERLVQCDNREVLSKRKRARIALFPIRELILDIDTRVTFPLLFNLVK